MPNFPTTLMRTARKRTFDSLQTCLLQQHRDRDLLHRLDTLIHLSQATENPTSKHTKSGSASWSSFDQ